MHILLLTEIVPYPPDSGPKIKTYHVLRYLSECGFDVTLVTFACDHEQPYVSQLEKYCREIYAIPLVRSKIIDAKAYVAGLYSGVPFLVTRDDRFEMRQVIDRLANRSFDLVHADQLTMAQYALQYRQSHRVLTGACTPIIFDAHNAVYEIFARARRTATPFVQPILMLEENRLKRYEGKLVEQFDRTLTVSTIDKNALLATDHAKINCESKITVIPIAVDCANQKPVQRTRSANNILIVSTLLYPPNADGVRWFLNKVFPSVQSKIPAVSLNIIGSRPPKDIVEFGARNSNCVSVTGYISDLQPYFERATLMVVPVLAGSGMRVRILEALSRGIPVVTTTTGAEGIDAIGGEHLLIADEPTEFAQAVVRLLANPILCETLLQNGRRLVEQKYDWQVVLPKLKAVYKSLDTRE